MRVRVQPRIHTNSGDTCRAAALHDQGIILQPDFLVGDDLRRGDAGRTDARVPLDRPRHPRGLRSRKYLPMKTRRLVDFLVEAFATPPWAT